MGVAQLSWGGMELGEVRLRAGVYPRELDPGESR